MAILHARESHFQLVLRPYGVSEKGTPTWILVQLEVRRDARALLSTSLCATLEDLDTLRACLLDVAAGRRPHCTHDTLDGDFILDVRRLEPPQDVAVGFWVGEPYVLMKGCRLVTSASNVERFVRELRAEEEVATAGEPGK